MPAGNSTRRDFLKLTGAGVAALSASSYARVLGANDRVGVGIIGFSDRCRGALIPSFLKSAPELNFEFVALSDIWSRRREEGVAYINKLSGKQIALARNNDELYDNRNVQAVIVATADFQHSFHGVEAIHAGRDVYVEKPLTLAPAESSARRPRHGAAAMAASRRMMRDRFSGLKNASRGIIPPIARKYWLMSSG